MNRRLCLSLMLAVASRAAFCLAAGPTPGDITTQITEECARPADALVDSIGVNVHLSYNDTSYRNYAEVIKPRLKEAGIRHIRDGCPPHWNQEVRTKLNDLAANSIRSLLICSPRSGTLEEDRRHAQAGPGLGRGRRRT